MKCMHHPCTKTLCINYRYWTRLILVSTAQACKLTGKNPYLRRNMSLFALTMPSTVVSNIFSIQGDYCHYENRLHQCNHENVKVQHVFIKYWGVV